jgi:serine/threonine-protein kinase
LAQKITRPGQILGDVRYMSPERSAWVGQIDGLSDIYSLGALTYTLLTGQPPVSGYNLVETVRQIRQTEPDRPRKFQMGIPEVFEGVVMKMQAKRPEDRHPSATDLLKDLGHVAKYQGVRL